MRLCSQALAMCISCRHIVTAVYSESGVGITCSGSQEAPSHQFRLERPGLQLLTCRGMVCPRLALPEKTVRRCRA